MTRTSIQKVTKGERAGAEKAHNTLFTPVRLGRTLLKHRVVMAPLTRSRSVQPDSIPGDLMAEYYRQRASDGGLMIGEATNISLSSRGWLGAPGLYTDEQVEGWKKVVSGVYARGGHMFAQLWHTGRSSHIAMTGGATPVSASVNPTYWEDPSHLISIPGGWAPPSPHRARISGSELVHKSQGALAAEWLRGIYRGQLIGAGGFEPDTAEEVVAAGILDAVAFGRHFIANPDLPARIQQGLALTPYDRRTFYTFDAHGYTDYAAYHAASGASAESRQPQQLNQ